ncbi:hypothetical protein BDV97DRAFT_40341 [Delphinella strobiligena]|nr:hypothetical protein BDV97DRAFT_40341 [Delphinella strobiligena]
MLRQSKPLLLLCSSLWSKSFAEASSNFSGQDVSSNLSSPDTASAESLSNYCQSVYSHFTRTYSSTILATSLHPWYEGFGPTDSNGVLTGPVTSQSYYTDTIIYTQYADRAYTAVPPCCEDCYMTAGTIEFYMWSDQASATSPPPESPRTIVNSDGFIFTSPSVYMAFSSLKASNMCGQVGDIWTSTTIGFDPTEITTANPITTLSVISTPYVEEGRTYDLIVSAITTQPPPQQIRYTDIGQNCSTRSDYTYWPDNPINADNGNYVHDPCHPIILLPSRLISMNPAWASASCSAAPGTTGAYDPPRVLTPAASVAPATFPGMQTMPAATRPAAGNPIRETPAPRTSAIAYYDNIFPSLVTSTVSGSVFIQTVTVLVPVSESSGPKRPPPGRPAYDSQSPSANTDETSSSAPVSTGSESSADPASAIASAMGVGKSSSQSDVSSIHETTEDQQSATPATDVSSGTSAKAVSSTSSSMASSSVKDAGIGVSAARTLGMLVLSGVLGLVLL